MPTTKADLVDKLTRLALFADVPRTEVEALAEESEEASFGEGEHVIKVGDHPDALYVILEGEVGVVIDDEERATLPTGAFFGEISLLLGEHAIADIVTRAPLHCLLIPKPELEAFLLANSQVTLNMLRTEARRVRSATEWHS